MLPADTECFRRLALVTRAPCYHSGSRRALYGLERGREGQGAVEVGRQQVVREKVFDKEVAFAEQNSSFDGVSELAHISLRISAEPAHLFRLKLTSRFGPI
jgi:hypothetical protein